MGDQIFRLLTSMLFIKDLAECLNALNDIQNFLEIRDFKVKASGKF